MLVFTWTIFFLLELGQPATVTPWQSQLYSSVAALNFKTTTVKCNRDGKNFIAGFKAKVELNGGDDTGVNRITIICRFQNGEGSGEYEVAQTEGTDWGEYGAEQKCPPSFFVTGIQLRQHANSGFFGGIFNDDAGTTDIRMICTNKYSESYPLQPSNGLDKGEWSLQEVFCPSGNAATGVKIAYKPEGGDDLGMVNAALICEAINFPPDIQLFVRGKTKRYFTKGPSSVARGWTICNEAGANLATIENSNDLQNAMETCKAATENDEVGCWTSGHFTGKHWVWKSEVDDASPNDFASRVENTCPKWRRGHGLSLDGYCVRVLPAGELDTLPCDTPQFVLCEEKTMFWNLKDKFRNDAGKRGKKDQKTTETICQQSFGRYLPKITNLLENDAVAKMCGADTCWLGLKDTEYQQRFRWQDGSELLWTNWATDKRPAEPNNGQKGDESSFTAENCVVIVGATSANKDEAGKWKDVRCGEQHEKICGRIIPKSIPLEKSSCLNTQQVGLTEPKGSSVKIISFGEAPLGNGLIPFDNPFSLCPTEINQVSVDVTWTTFGLYQNTNGNENIGLILGDVMNASSRGFVQDAEPQPYNWEGMTKLSYFGTCLTARLATKEPYRMFMGRVVGTPTTIISQNHLYYFQYVIRDENLKVSEHCSDGDRPPTVISSITSIKLQPPTPSDASASSFDPSTLKISCQFNTFREGFVVSSNRRIVHIGVDYVVFCDRDDNAILSGTNSVSNAVSTPQGRHVLPVETISNSFELNMNGAVGCDKPQIWFTLNRFEISQNRNMMYLPIFPLSVDTSKEAPTRFTLDVSTLGGSRVGRIDIEYLAICNELIEDQERAELVSLVLPSLRVTPCRNQTLFADNSAVLFEIVSSSGRSGILVGTNQQLVNGDVVMNLQAAERSAYDLDPSTFISLEIFGNPRAVNEDDGTHKTFCFEALSLTFKNQTFNFDHYTLLKNGNTNDKFGYAISFGCLSNVIEIGPEEYAECERTRELFFNEDLEPLKYRIDVTSCPVKEFVTPMDLVAQLEIGMTGVKNSSNITTNTEYVSADPISLRGTPEWKPGFTKTFYFVKDSQLWSRLSLVTVVNPLQASSVTIQIRVCPPLAYDAREMGDVDSLFAFMRVFVRVRGTNPRLQPRKELSRFTFGETIEVTFAGDIGRITHIIFESELIPGKGTQERTLSNMFACIEKLSIKFSGEASFTDISLIMHTENSRIGRLGRVGDERNGLYTQVLEMPKKTSSLFEKTRKVIGAFCVSAISVNGRKSNLVGNVIGGCDTCQAVAIGYLLLPACKSTLKRCVWQKKKIESQAIAPPPGGQAGLCENKNRFVEGHCTVAKSVGISTSNSLTVDTSTGREMATMEFNSKEAHPVSHSLQYGGSLDVIPWVFDGGQDEKAAPGRLQGPMVTIGVHFSGETSLSHTIASSGKENSRTTVTSRGRSIEEVTTNEESVECSGEVGVPPGHSQTYNLEFTSQKIEWEYLCDLEVVTCSQYALNPRNPGVLTISGIKVSVEEVETPTCKVTWNTAELIPNKVTCKEERALAFLSGATFVPDCSTTDNSKYNPCQCADIDSLTSPVCACFLPSGDIDKEKGARDRNEGESNYYVCNVLGCPPTSKAPTVTTKNSTRIPTSMPSASPITQVVQQLNTLTRLDLSPLRLAFESGTWSARYILHQRLDASTPCHIVATIQGTGPSLTSSSSEYFQYGIKTDGFSISFRQDTSTNIKVSQPCGSLLSNRAMKTFVDTSYSEWYPFGVIGAPTNRIQTTLELISNPTQDSVAVRFQWVTGDQQTKQANCIYFTSGVIGKVYIYLTPLSNSSSPIESSSFQSTGRCDASVLGKLREWGAQKRLAAPQRVVSDSTVKSTGKDSDKKMMATSLLVDAATKVIFGVLLLIGCLCSLKHIENILVKRGAGDERILDVTEEESLLAADDHNEDGDEVELEDV